MAKWYPDKYANWLSRVPPAARAINSWVNAWRNDSLAGKVASIWSRVSSFWTPGVAHAYTLIISVRRVLLQVYGMHSYEIAVLSYYTQRAFRYHRVAIRWIQYTLVPALRRYVDARIAQQRKYLEWYARHHDELLRRKLMTVIRNTTYFLEHAIAGAVRELKTDLHNQRGYLIGRIVAAEKYLQRQLAAAVKKLESDLAAQRKYLLGKINAIIPQVNKDASDAYDATMPGRFALVTKLLDLAVIHDPAVKDAVGALVTAVIDLAEVDDPVARFAAQKILTEVVDKLGIDTLIGSLVSDITSGLLTAGKPKTLAATETSTGDRLNAAESGLAALAPLNDEVALAKVLGSLGFDAALVAFLVSAIAAPVATANDTHAVIQGLTAPLRGPVEALLGIR